MWWLSQSERSIIHNLQHDSKLDRRWSIELVTTIQCYNFQSLTWWPKWYLRKQSIFIVSPWADCAQHIGSQFHGQCLMMDFRWGSGRSYICLWRRGEITFHRWRLYQGLFILPSSLQKWFPPPDSEKPEKKCCRTNNKETNSIGDFWWRAGGSTSTRRELETICTVFRIRASATSV